MHKENHFPQRLLFLKCNEVFVKYHLISNTTMYILFVPRSDGMLSDEYWVYGEVRTFLNPHYLVYVTVPVHLIWKLGTAMNFAANFYLKIHIKKSPSL